MPVTTRTVAAAVTLALSGCASSPLPMNTANLQTAPANTDWNSAQRIEVKLDDFEFTPEKLAFQAGRPIKLVLSNIGSGDHDFSAPRFFADAAFRPGSTLPNRGTVTLGKRETIELDFIPSAPGSYPLECTEFLHSMFGMTGAITVEAKAK